MNAMIGSIEAQEVVHQCSDCEDVSGVDSSAHDLEPNLVVLLNYHIFLLCLIAGRRWVGIEGHVSRNRVARYEAGKRPNLGKYAHFVNLSDHPVEYLAFEWPEDDRFVFDRVGDKAGATLDDAGANVVDGGHGYDEAMFASARALHLIEQLLPHSVQQLDTEVARVQLDLVLKTDVKEHFRETDGSLLLFTSTVKVSPL